MEERTVGFLVVRLDAPLDEQRHPSLQNVRAVERRNAEDRGQRGVQHTEIKRCTGERCLPERQNEYEEEHVLRKIDAHFLVDRLYSN